MKPTKQELDAAHVVLFGSLAASHKDEEERMFVEFFDECVRDGFGVESLDGEKGIRLPFCEDPVVYMFRRWCDELMAFEYAFFREDAGKPIVSMKVEEFLEVLGISEEFAGRKVASTKDEVLNTIKMMKG